MAQRTVPYLVVRKTAVQSDWKLTAQPKETNNGRKYLVNQIYPRSEVHAQDSEWVPGTEMAKTAIIETGLGGLEAASFTHDSQQDCHKHLLGTEIYSVLEGAMRMRLEEDELIELQVGDEIVVLPGTVHEVLPEGTQFLTRVHSFNCYGDADKYVKNGQSWCQVLTLKILERN